MTRLATRRPGLGRLAAAVALSLGLAAPAAGTAFAATLSLVGGKSVTLPTGCGTGAFDPVNFCTPNADTASYLALDPEAAMRPGATATRIGAALKNANPGFGLHLDKAARVSFTYMLKEASWTNLLVETASGWNPIFQTGVTGFGTTSGSYLMGPGLLEFSLKTVGQALSFANDGATVGKVGVAFSAIFNNGRSVIIGYDDSGAGPDRDYDDLVARIDVAPVPLPAAAGLMLAALSGLGLVVRRRAAA